MEKILPFRPLADIRYTLHADMEAERPGRNTQTNAANKMYSPYVANR